MNNEIQRKITSLTLMTIMLAGGMTIAFPGFTPTASAEVTQTANLYVSSVNFGGPMVLEIVVNDPSIRQTDESKGQPNVTIDGDDLVMAQGDDGSWYAYVAAQNVVDALPNTNIDFGVDCTKTLTVKGDFDDAAEVFCNGDDRQNVLNNERSLNKNSYANPGGEGDLGQIELKSSDEDKWPFIQTFSFTDAQTVAVIYGGSPDQVVSLTYTEDMDDFASYSLDKNDYAHNADIHLVIDDMQLNIDPTDEDTWTFNVENKTSWYGIVDETTDLTTLADITPAKQNALYYDDNGFLDLDVKNVLVLKPNDDHFTSVDYGPAIVVTESAPNSGVFDNTDDSDKSDLFTTDAKIRDKSGIIEYNADKSSIFVKYFGGTIDMDIASIDGEWSSGEPLTVVITDQDANTNTKLDNDFDVSDAIFTVIPTIEIGSPTTLESTSVVTITGQMDTTDLVNALKELTDRETIVDKWVFDNQTAWTEIESNTNAAVLNTNQTKWDAFVIVNSTELDDLWLRGATQGAIDAKQALLDNAVIGVNQIAEEITALFTPTELIVKSKLDIAIVEQTSLVEQIKATNDSLNSASTNAPATFTVTQFSKILRIDATPITPDANPTVVIDTGISSNILDDFVNVDGVHTLINYDIRSLNQITASVNGLKLDDQGLIYVNQDVIDDITSGNLVITVDSEGLKGKSFNVVFDILTFGQSSDGKRYNDAIYRFEAEETTSVSGIYTGTVEYIMLNQINIFNADTFASLETIGDELDVIVHEDLTDEDAVEIVYLDTDNEGEQTTISAKEDAPTYSGMVTFDSTNYKVADTVIVTVNDPDLNTDSELPDVYVVRESDSIGDGRSLLLDITFNDAKWKSCDGASGLFGSMSTIIETGDSTGVFIGTFQIPKTYCQPDGDTFKIDSVTGVDLEVNYQDFRDASGETIETGDSAGISANTGSVAFDRTVYSVPYGTSAEGESYFPLHATAGGELGVGDLTVHIRVNDPDFDLAPNGEDKIEESTDNGPVKVTISRGSNHVVLATAGASSANSKQITIGEDVIDNTLELGPILEIAPDAGIFELDLTIRFTDGPVSSACPTTKGTIVSDRIAGASNDDKHCILQGDILTVEYTDPTDASGEPNTVTDSATFDLRNGVLQSDKSVYLIGSDMILTLIEPDFDLDNDGAESYSLDLIEWDSDAAITTLGKDLNFDPEPSSFRETGDSTGIFQVVIEIPAELDSNNLNRGEQIVLEYTDWGPSGSNYVGDEDEDVNVTIFTSNFGATVELDQKVYTWTDKVYITIVAPDHNFDGDLVDEIGNTAADPIKVSTRGSDIDNYKLVETGTDTGIFTGEVILTGFPEHDADGDGTETDATGAISLDNGGPTDGLLPADDDDGLTVSFEFSEDETVIGSALIRWNIGETQWLEASYPASGTGVVRIIDPDMNFNPEAVDNFAVDVWSDSDAGGIDLTVTETNEATGIFEGTVFFTTSDESSGHRLRVAEGDTVTAEYEDNTLPDPYTTADELDITATTLIGTIVPPLERAPAANLRTVDAFGNSLDVVTVDQQVQLTADLINGQDREQAFAYLLQVQDSDGVTVKLDWITGSLTSGQSFSPAVSWTPSEAGAYTATVFVWESVDNPTALSPPVSITVNVS